MMVLLSLFACTPSENFSAEATGQRVQPSLDRPELTVLDAEDSALEERAPVSFGPMRIEIQLPMGTTDGFIEVRPYRADGDELTWIGRPLVTHEVEGTRETITLPVDAPRRDRLSPDELVTYAVAFRADDGTGHPGLYKGVATPRIVHVREDAPAGALLGWNVVTGIGTADPLWLDPEDVMFLDANVIGTRTALVGGTSAVEVTGDTRIVVATSPDPDADVLLDEPVRSDAWSVLLAGSPTSLPLGTADADEDLPVGTSLYVFAYEDEDGDAERGAAPIEAHPCAGSDPAVLTWFEPATTFAQALTYARVGARGGWDMVRHTDPGAWRLSETERTHLVLDKDCR